MTTLSALIRQQSSPLDIQPTGEEPHLPALPGIKAVVFDVYGTLFLSGTGDIGILEADRGDALAHALNAIGCEGDLDRAGQACNDLIDTIIRLHHRQRKADGVEFPEVDIRSVWREAVRELLAQGHLKAIPDDDDIPRIAILYETMVNPVWPMPGLTDTLRDIRQADYTLGIVSNAQFYTPLLFDAFLEQSLADLGFHPDLCIYSYALLEAKPSVALYQQLTDTADKLLDLRPEEILYVGNDMRNDIWPASQTGCRTALFAGDQRSLRWRREDPRVTATQPDVILTELAQLHQVLDL